MVNQRNRVIKLKKYLETIGIEINIGKNKARGNKGVFVSVNNNYRIDIAKSMSDEDIFSTMLHEYTHFVHYKYDKTLKSFDFMFPDFSDEMMQELINISVEYVPKEFAAKLFNTKDKINSEIQQLQLLIKKDIPNFQLSKPCIKIENRMTNIVKYFLKYDRVKIMNKTYCIEDIIHNTPGIHQNVIYYIQLKSKQRMLRRINSRICRLNKYYNKPTELIARFVELFFTKSDIAQKIAPLCVQSFKKALHNNLEKDFLQIQNILG